MSEPIDPSQMIEQPEAAQEVVEPTAQASSQEGQVNAMTKIGSMAELREKAPEVYKKMMEGLAMNMINEMRRRQDRLKKMMREYRRQAGIR